MSEGKGRQERLRRDMALSAAIQEAAFTRSAERIERDYATASRCQCHSWENYRCHVVQIENARAYVARKNGGARLV